MKVNVYRVVWYTVFEKYGKEVRRTGPVTTLAAARDEAAAFKLIPVPPGTGGEIVHNVAVTAHQLHSSVLVEALRADYASVT